MLGTQKDWIDILVSIGNLTIPFALVWIAYQQWNTMEKQRKHQKIQIYSDCYKKLLRGWNEIMNSKTIPEIAITIYGDALTDADLFLPEEIRNKIKKQLDEIIEVQGLEFAIAEALDNEKQKKDKEKKFLLKAHFISYSNKLRNLFKKHLAE